MDLKHSGPELDRYLSRLPWESWVPTYSPGTATTHEASYLKLGKMVYFYITFTLTSTVASSSMVVSLPIIPISGAVIVGMGREVVASGKAVSAAGSGLASMVIRWYDASSGLVTSGYRYSISGHYEIL